MKTGSSIDEIYETEIKRLPKADIPFSGIKGWLSQGEDHQIVFFEIESVGKVAEHSHGTQWGIVFDGEMDLTIGNETKTYKKGDCYHIPSGVVHSATFKKRTRVMDFFDESHRYHVKT